MQVQGSRTRVDLPSGWTEVDRNLLPSRMAQLPQIDLFCTGPVSIDRYAANLVVMIVRLPRNTTEAEWFRESTAQLESGIPGFRLIDLLGWQSPDWNDPNSFGVTRTGVYILDEVSLTAQQWSWVEEGWGYTATATSTTRDIKSLQEDFEQISHTLGTV